MANSWGTVPSRIVTTDLDTLLHVNVGWSKEVGARGLEQGGWSKGVGARRLEQGGWSKGALEQGGWSKGALEQGGWGKGALEPDALPDANHRYRRWV